MPATFESLGIRFLYPDNWVVVERPAEEGIDGVTLEMPSGGFFSIEKVSSVDLDEESLIGAVEAAIAEEYGEVEREELPVDPESNDRTMEFRFYYLDLMILSRLLLITVAGMRFVIQIQAENRDFDENEMVFTALLKQIRDT